MSHRLQIKGFAFGGLVDHHPTSKRFLYFRSIFEYSHKDSDVEVYTNADPWNNTLLMSISTTVDGM